MGYRNKTYVVFDGDRDMWAYAYMLGWSKNKNIEFRFHDAHDLNKLTSASGEQNTKRKLRERFSSAKQVVVIIGDKTKNLYRFVRWEMEVAQNLGLPIIAVNLNGLRKMDPDLCPPILKNADALHVSFNARIIKKAMDDFCANFTNYESSGENWKYDADVYRDLGL